MPVFMHLCLAGGIAAPRALHGGTHAGAVWGRRDQASALAIALVLVLTLAGFLMLGSGIANASDAEAASVDGGGAVDTDAVLCRGSRDDDPRYVIYMQPAPINPLYAAIQRFINRWPYDPYRNEATYYPPHVSMTGFFSKTTAQQQAIIAAIDRAIGKVGLPFGRPRLSKVARSQSSDDDWVVRLDVEHVPRYHEFIDKVVKDLDIQNKRKLVRKYHITLGDVPGKGTSTRILDDARSTFPKSGLDAFNTDPRFATWDIAVYRAHDGVKLGLDFVARWQVNP